MQNLKNSEATAMPKEREFSKRPTEIIPIYFPIPRFIFYLLQMSFWKRFFRKKRSIYGSILVGTELDFGHNRYGKYSRLPLGSQPEIDQYEKFVPVPMAPFT